jgi:hypothetical protein
VEQLVVFQAVLVQMDLEVQVVLAVEQVLLIYLLLHFQVVQEINHQ